MERYAYRSLATRPQNIRLLYLLPGHDEEDIRCELIHYTLRPERPFGLYEALSYVWGDQNDTRRIRIRNADDFEFRYLNVTVNLYAALLRLRDPELRRTLWIDALCINQHSLDERAAQVQIMHFIYAYAMSVTVWLGEEKDGSPEVLRLLEQISLSPVPDDSWTKQPQGSELDENWTKKLHELAGPLKESLQTLLARPWFGRIWVIQEAGAARHISVVCGQAEITGATFLKGVQHLAPTNERRRRYIKGQLPAVLGLFMDGSKLHLDRGLPGLPSNATLGLQSLPELLGKFHLHAASDRRDKIYALCSMADDIRDIPNLKVDYNKSWSDLLKSVTRYIFGPRVTITTTDQTDQAIITGFGLLLGLIKTTHLRKQSLSPLFCGIRGEGYTISIDLDSSEYARQLQDGDMVCLLEGARYPSVFRLCGNHFDLIVPALIIGSGTPVEIEAQVMTSRGSNIRVSNSRASWDEFASSINAFPRYVVLAWDWLPPRQSSFDEHDALFNPGQHSDDVSYSTRFFSAAQLLEDAQDQKQLSELVKTVRPPMLVSARLLDLKMLAIVCEHWDAYIRFKKYMSQLRWSAWALSTSITISWSKDGLVLKYWRTEGFTEWDLFAIADVVYRASERLTDDIYTCEIKRNVFDEQDITPIFCLLFPRSSYLTTSATTIAGASVAPFGGRYLMQLVLSTISRHQSNWNDLLEYMLDRRYGYHLVPAIELLLSMLSESNSDAFKITPGIRIRLQRRTDFRKIWRFLIIEYSGEAELVFTILREACLSAKADNNPYLQAHDDAIDAEFYTWRDCVSAAAVSLQRCVQLTDICTLAVNDWDARSSGSISVLQFLCETFNDPPEGLPSAQPHIEAYLDQQSQWRQGWILWTGGNTHSRDERIHLARVCLIGAMQARREADGHCPTVIAGEDKIDHTMMINALELLRGQGASKNSDYSGEDVSGRSVSSEEEDIMSEFSSDVRGPTGLST